MLYERHCPFLGSIPLSESETDSENQSAEGGIQITLGPTLLDDTLDTTRLAVDDSLTDPSLSEGALGRRGLL